MELRNLGKNLLGVGAIVALLLVAGTGCQTTPQPQPNPCTGNPCDDGNLCTTDTCEVVDGEAVCTNAPVVCGDLQVCDAETGDCIDVDCIENADCGDLQICTDNECVDVDCVDNDDCADLQICTDNACVDVDCLDNDDCAAGEVCTDYICVEEVVACTTNGDCPDDGLFCTGDPTCTAGVCGFSGDPCAAGETCDEDLNTCGVATEAFTLTAPATSAEGDSGTTALEFTLGRAGGDGDAKTVNWAVTSAGGVGTVATDDFVGGAFPTGTVDFAADDFADKTITIDVQGDTNVEEDEVFTVTVTDAGTDVATVDGTITNDDSTADPVVTLPTDAGATVGQNSLITGISVADADNTTSTVNIVTGDGFLSFSAAPACTAVDGAGNAVAAANVLKDEYVLTGTIININTTLAGFQFTTDRSTSNPGTDQVTFTATDADGGTGTATLDIAVGVQRTLTAGSDTGALFAGTPGGDVFLAVTPAHFGQGDVLDGEDGHDRIEIRTPAAATYPAAAVAAFSAINIEEIWLNQIGAGGAPILDNFVDMPDVDTIVYSPGAANLLTINDAPNNFTLIVDTRNAAFAANIDVDIVNPVFGTQAFTLDMQGQSAAGTPLVINSVISGTQGIETLNINSVSQNGTTCTNTITGASTINVTTVNITGDQDLAAGAWTGANTKTINAETFTGKLTVTSAIAGATITGGTAADTLNGGAGAQSFSGGAGADTINPAAAADLVQTGADADTIVVVTADVAAAGGAVVYDRWTDFTTGSGGDAMDWNTALNVDNGAVGPPFTSANYLSAAATDTMITGAAANVVIFEFTGAALANDIVPGTTTSATIEGWAAAALATVDHTHANDQLLFVMYDTGTGASLDAAIFSFSGDVTLTGMLAAEFQLIAVVEGVVLDSFTADNFK